MNKLVKISFRILSGFIGLGFVSCGTQAPLKAEDFKYFNPDFKFDDSLGLRTDGAYVNVTGSYTKTFSPEEFNLKFNRDRAQANKLEIPEKDSVVIYETYEILIFCRQDGAYFYANGTNFNIEKLYYYKKFSEEEICGKKYPNFYYQFSRNKIDLEHIEYWQNSKVNIKEEARVLSDTLFLKKISNDWSKKRVETPFKFYPFN